MALRKNTRIEQQRLDTLLATAIDKYADAADFRALLEKGADPDAPSGKKKASPIGRLVVTTSHKRLECVEALLDAGADASRGDFKGTTPLHTLCNSTTGGNDAIVALLIDRKANVNAQDNAGETPLHTAVRRWVTSNGPWAVLKLLESGADMNAQNHIGETPLQIAMDHRYTPASKQAVREMFLSYAAKHKESPQAQRDLAAENIRKLRARRGTGPGLKI